MQFIEPLESRIAPAITVDVIAGVLTIQHTGATGEQVVVEQTGPDAFNVKDTTPGTGSDFGGFAGVNAIDVQVGNLGDIAFTPVIDLKFSTDGLAGALTIQAAGGTNTINLHTITGNSSSKIGGPVNITGGDGADTLSITGGLAIASPVEFNGGDGSDSFIPDGAYLAKKLTLESVEDITTASVSNPFVVGGLLVENEDPNGGVIFNFTNVVTVAGKLTYCGSDTETDDVTLNCQVTGPALLMLLGGENHVTTSGQFASKLTITGGGEDDTVVFNHSPLDASATPRGFMNANVAGALSMQLGDGTNDVTLDNNSYFGKGLKLTTGAGNDTVHFSEFISAKNVSLALGDGSNTLDGTSSLSENNFIAKNFKYTGGADADTVGLGNLIAGTMKITLGDGINGLTGDARIVGKSFTLKGGADIDTITLSLASTAGKLKAKLFAGDDSFTFNGGALASAKIDGGDPKAPALPGDTFTNEGNLPANHQLIGFETVT